MKIIFVLWCASLTILAAAAESQVLAQRGVAVAAVEDFDAQHFLSSDARRKTLKSNEQDVLKTIDEILNVRTFNAKTDWMRNYDEVEKSYAQLQEQKSKLAAALAIAERRAREKFSQNSDAMLPRARELWTVDNEKYFSDEEVDITAIYIDLSKRSWEENSARISEALRQLKSGAPFEQVMVAHTDDPQVEKNKGALKGVKAQFADPNLVRPLFRDLKLGEFSQPLSTRRKGRENCTPRITSD
jgi:hypothetical protein